MAGLYAYNTRNINDLVAERESAESVFAPVRGCARDALKIRRFSPICIRARAPLYASIRVFWWGGKWG